MKRKHNQDDATATEDSGDEDKASVEEDDEKEEEVFVSLVFCTKKWMLGQNNTQSNIRIVYIYYSRII